jgi:hypothetical protein
MNILFVHNGGRRIGTLRLGPLQLALAALLLLLLVPVGFLAGGYLLGKTFGDQPYTVLVGAWKEQMAEQSERIDEVGQSLRQNMDAMAMRLGQLQAHVIRLDALGARLTKMAKLDKGEFDFTPCPPRAVPSKPARSKP